MLSTTRFIECRCQVKQLGSTKTYETKLKEDLACFHCHKEMKNIPTLKEHLQEEWDKLATKASHKRKRKAESADVELVVPKEKRLSDSEKELKRAKSEANKDIEE